jgi:hypothetical protein
MQPQAIEYVESTETSRRAIFKEERSQKIDAGLDGCPSISAYPVCAEIARRCNMCDGPESEINNVIPGRVKSDSGA